MRWNADPCTCPTDADRLRRLLEGVADDGACPLHDPEAAVAAARADAEVDRHRAEAEVYRHELAALRAEPEPEAEVPLPLRVLLARAMASEGDDLEPALEHEDHLEDRLRAAVNLPPVTPPTAA
jgi:hypothetical protein